MVFDGPGDTIKREIYLLEFLASKGGGGDEKNWAVTANEINYC